jgi:glycosyltransferase involved in cell wall biosynthesis
MSTADTAPASDAPLLVSVIVPLRNEETTVRWLLDSLERQQTSFPWEVIFVDGGSTDHTCEVITQHPLARRIPVRILHSPPDRLGMNHARNDGAKAARGSILLFTQADIHIEDPHALETTVRCFEDPEVVATTFTGLGAGRAFADYDFWGQVFMARYQRLRCFHDLDTKFNAVRRSVFERVGGFDEQRFPFGGEDFDFRVRLAHEGRIADTGIEVEHLHGYGRRHRPWAMLRKYARNAECMGATVPVYLRNLDHEPGYLRDFMLRNLLALAAIGSLHPATWPWTLLVVGAFSVAWSWPIYREVRSWKLIWIPGFAFLAMYVFALYYLRGWILGRTCVRLRTTSG